MTRKSSGIDMLFVSHMHQAIGGAEMALLEMVEYLSKQGLRVHVVVGMEDSLSETLTTMGIPFTPIGLPWWVRGPGDTTPFAYSGPNPIANTTLQLVELIQTLQPQLCVTNTIVVPWLAYAAAMTGTAHAWLVHEMGTSGLQLHYDLGETQTLRTIDELSDKIFYNSRATAAYYTTQFIHHKDVALVYPGGKQPEPASVASPYRPEAFKLAAVGQIKPQKAQLDAIHAVQQLVSHGYDVQLAIIGAEEDPAYVQNLWQYVDKHNLHEAVIFAGYQKNPASYVALADAALTCATNEAFGRVTVEAMLLGKPVIGAKSGGTIEIINDMSTGLYYKPGDDVDLASQIKRLIDDPKLRRRLGRSAQTTAQTLYADEVRYAEFLAYFNSLSTDKTALALSPLTSTFSDFRKTIGLLEHRTAQLERITNSLPYRVLRKTRNLIRR